MNYYVSQAKPDFGTLKPLQYASDYIANKKAKFVCSNKKRSRLVTCCLYPQPVDLINKTQLNYNLYTQQNLLGVDVLQFVGPPPVSPTNIDLSLNFVQNYTIYPHYDKAMCPIDYNNSFLQEKEI
jgi:hypothetical protein